MSDSLQRWAREKTCCCHYPDAHECAEARYPCDPPGETEPCDCYCHDEFLGDDDDR